MKYTRNLNQISKNDVPIAGGKGASLGEMIQAGFPVPKGFVVLTNAYENFLKNSALALEIEKEIKQTFSELGAKRVAVRSSATAEDGLIASWAGQLDTYLNITEENLIENIKKCWASLSSERAIAYQSLHGGQGQKISVAVVIQQMIEAEAAGTVFSVHPVTQNQNELIIEAVFGLGEALVSGEATPDSYIVQKRPRKIIDKKSQQEKQVLPDSKILELSNFVLSIEKHYGFPCDIEWALEKNKFYILQSRPITTLQLENPPHLNRMVSLGKRPADLFFSSLKIMGWSKGLREELGAGYTTISIDSDGEILVDSKEDNIIRAKLSTQKPSDAIEYINKIRNLKTELEETLNHKVNLDIIHGLIKMFAYFIIAKTIIEEVYANSTDREQKIFDAWRSEDLIFDVTEMLYKVGPTHYPELQNINGMTANDVLNILAEKHTDNIGFRPSTDWKLSFLNDVVQIKKKPSQRILTKSTTRERTLFYVNIWYQSDKQTYLKWANMNFVGSLFIGEGKTKKVSAWYDQSLGDIFTTEVARRAKKDTAYIAAVFDVHKTGSERLELFITGKRKISSLGDLKDYYQTFIDWWLPMSILLEFPDIPGIDKSILHKANSLRKKTEQWAEKADELFLNFMHTVFPALDAIASVMMPEEIFSLADKGLPLAVEKKISKRLFGYCLIDGAIYNKNKLHEILDTKGYSLEKKSHLQVSKIRGLSASLGKVTGKVRIIHYKDDLPSFQEGEVLVSEMTTPDFLSAVQKSVAVITDEGGITSHAAITARELGKPCVINTKVATEILKDGDLVEVDASNGIVRILKNKSG